MPLSVAFFGQADTGLAGLRQEKDYFFRDGLAVAAKSELLLRPEIPGDSHIPLIYAGFFAGFAYGGFEHSFFGFNFTFREIPIIPSVIENKKNRSIFCSSENNYSGGCFSFHRPLYGGVLFRRVLLRNGHGINNTTRPEEGMKTIKVY